MNKIKAGQPVARQQMTLTPEQREEQVKRAYLQKKAALAEGILFNMVQGNGTYFCANEDSTTHLVAVRKANEMAEEFMKVVYQAEIIVKNEEGE